MSLIAYAYVGYPAVIFLMARLRSREIDRGPIRPRLTLLIVAHNEALRIARKVENCLALDYPRDRLELIVASDGSTDGTADALRCFESQGVTVLAFESRRGKPSVLNDVIPRCNGDIVVLSDVRQAYDRTALAALVDTFHDPTVGAVSGELVLTSTGSGIGEGLGLYWRYEKFIRRHESSFDSTFGATGAIYAIRRRLFAPIPADTLLDDVLIPMGIVRRGYRVVFEPRAKAFDRAAETSAEEFTRKVRTTAGNLQLFTRERWVWSPKQNRLWFQAISHKLLRIVVPFLLVTACATSAALTSSNLFYAIVFLSQCVFYGTALTGCFLGRVPVVGRWLAVPYAFCLLNVTALVGVMRFMNGTQTVTWLKATDFGSAPPETQERD